MNKRNLNKPILSIFNKQRISGGRTKPLEIFTKKKDITAQIKKRIQDVLKMKTSRRKAVVFDIDDTLIEDNQIKNDPNIPHVRSIYRYLANINTGIPKNQHIYLYIVTARKQNYLRETIEDLNKKGFIERKHQHSSRQLPYDKLYLRPENMESSTFKKSIRSRIGRHHDLLLTAGDQWWDHVNDDVSYMSNLTSNLDAKYGNRDMLLYLLSTDSILSWKLKVRENDTEQ